MPRKAVPLVTNETYHVYNRGVDKRTIFQDKYDFNRFHTCLQLFNAVEQSGSVYELQFKSGWIQAQTPLVGIHAYCLLGNHFHLVLTQLRDGGVSEFMKRMSGGYTSYFNERHERSGVLFQGKFKRVHCTTNEQLLYVAAYVNANHLVHKTDSFYYSSLDVYTGKRSETWLKKDLVLAQYRNGQAYEAEARTVAKEIARKRKTATDYQRDILLE